jgi:hypothetical protein
LSDKDTESNAILSYKCEEMGEQIKIMNDHIKYLTEEVMQINLEYKNKS